VAWACSLIAAPLLFALTLPPLLHSLRSCRTRGCPEYESFREPCIYTYFLGEWWLIFAAALVFRTISTFYRNTRIPEIPEHPTVAELP